jgi:hypothetical protein
MKITIDHNQRVFLVKGDDSRAHFFCNLKDVQGVIKMLIAENHAPKIYEYWNQKFTRLTKARINEYFEANQIDFKLK